MIQLTPTENEVKEHLIEKFRIEPLTREETMELKRILEKERQQAFEMGDFALLLAIGALLVVLVDSLSSKRSFWKRLLGVK
jgi:hypothetical protein